MKTLEAGIHLVEAGLAEIRADNLVSGAKLATAKAAQALIEAGKPDEAEALLTVGKK